jgi:hypothetical protein
MAFAMHIRPGGGAAVIVCDQCGEHIRDAGMATVYWQRTETTGSVAIFIVHKQPCHSAFDAERNAKAWPTMELRHFMADVADNIGMPPEDWPKARASADSIRNLGT